MTQPARLVYVNLAKVPLIFAKFCNGLDTSMRLGSQHLMFRILLLFIQVSSLISENKMLTNILYTVIFTTVVAYSHTIIVIIFAPSGPPKRFLWHAGTLADWWSAYCPASTLMCVSTDNNTTSSFKIVETFPIKDSFSFSKSLVLRN